MDLKPSWIRATLLAVLRPSTNLMRKFGGHVEPLSNGSSSCQHIVISTQSRIVGDRLARPPGLAVAGHAGSSADQGWLMSVEASVPAANQDRPGKHIEKSEVFAESIDLLWPNTPKLEM
jgi:hypothetical protein